MVNGGAMSTALLLLREMRPKQWTKNLLLFAGIIFSQHLQEPHRVVSAVFAFIIFCALSSAVYIINDIRDAETDRQHPLKAKRPIASGELSVRFALTAAIVLAVVGLVWAFFVHWRPGVPLARALNVEFGVLALAYFLLISAYSLGLKHFVIIDLMVVAIGFVIRAVAGVEAIELPGETIRITAWFITCILFLALFIAICKRRHELLLLSESARNHRPVLEHYTQAFLDQMVSVATAAAILSYALYVTLGVAQTSQSHLMIYTVPLVLYGIFRYLYLVYRCDEGGSPEVLLLQDRWLLGTVLIWLAAVVAIFYSGQA
jgi:4-hydroxybenzoate polyprenyltransferase